MALTKVVYVNGVTVITAENLNEIQDAIIALETAGIPTDVVQYVAQTLTAAQQMQARSNIGAASTEDLTTVIAKPASAANGDFLCYNSASDDWEATTVPTYNGGSY